MEYDGWWQAQYCCRRNCSMLPPSTSFLLLRLRKIVKPVFFAVPGVNREAKETNVDSNQDGVEKPTSGAHTNGASEPS